MRKKTWLQEKVNEFADDPAYLTERHLLKFTEDIISKMKEQNIPRNDLAQRMGVSKAMVTKLLRGNPNMTLKTMVTISQAINCELEVDIRHRGYRLPNLCYCEGKPYVDHDIEEIGDANAAAA